MLKNRKVIRNISLDFELDEWLKTQQNASSLINQLVRDEMEQTKLVSLGVEKLDKLMELAKARDRLNAEMEQIANGH